MIISRQNGYLVMVRQDEHMIHAAEITRRWGNEYVGKPTPNDSVVMAIGQHDLGWKKPDDEVLFNSEMGQPVNFMDVNLRQHVEFYGDGYERAVQRDPYAGLLIGMHWIGLYTSRFGYDPTFTYKTSEDLKAFMNETIRTQQKNWIEIKHEMWKHHQPRREFEDKIWLHYELFQVMDRISLFICLSDHDRIHETTLGPVRFTLNGDYKHLKVRTTGHGEITVDPFPFDQAFDVSVPFRRISDKRYASQEEAREAFHAANPDILKCKIIPG